MHSLSCERWVRTIQFIHQGLQLLHRDPLDIAYFVLVQIQVDLGSDKEDVVDCLSVRGSRTFMLAPGSRAWCQVVDTCQELEHVHGNL